MAGKEPVVAQRQLSWCKWSLKWSDNERQGNGQLTVRKHKYLRLYIFVYGASLPKAEAAQMIHAGSLIRLLNRTFSLWTVA